MASTAAAALAERPISASAISAAQSQSEGAKLIDGTALAKDIRASVASRISALRAQNARFHPHLAIVQAGSRPDSTAYIRMKTKACEEVGIKSTHIQLPGDVSTQGVLDVVKKLNDDETVSGVLVQLPIGDGDGIGAEAERVVVEKLGAEKDVDG
ncbi:methylenetetrahydrofolate dehydrogenase (NADP+) / methenyltetrahydrofolate cyclohydrolase / formyltetrahydrofolate synthetase [Rhizoctonia solani AG-1 IB]|nr:methylenetetrahydrofolate dehydrogenase (NADP+) / methenyltetrahydrofolate cyclohydrolase / formyltetrahydrofolate synthetase [Rhizoctonia solani AG-1 IB]